MSTSETSLNLCFCLLLIIEKAISKVSSGFMRGKSPMGRNSPPSRIIGKAPTLRWRSEAPWLVAAFNRSSIFRDIVGLVPFRTNSEGFGLNTGTISVSILNRMKSADCFSGGLSQAGRSSNTSGIIARRSEKGQRSMFNVVAWCGYSALSGLFRKKQVS